MACETVLVITARGLVARNLLEVSDRTEWNDDARVTVTEWRLDGELVRSDLHVNLLRGDSALGEQGSI